LAVYIADAGLTATPSACRSGLVPAIHVFKFARPAAFNASSKIALPADLAGWPHPFLTPSTARIG